MGCASSKLDDLPAVALCRDRCGYLDEAIRLRYVMAQSHLAYTHSLKTVGASLNRFFDRDLDHFAIEPPSPVLNLPGHRKGDAHQPSSSTTDAPKKLASESATAKSAVHHQHTRSHSGSHLHFHSDDDDDGGGGSEDDDHDHDHLHLDDDSDSSFHHHHGGHGQLSDSPSSPFNPYGGQFTYPNSGYPPAVAYPGSYPGSSYPGAGGGTYMHMNYMRKQPTQSVLYQQKPFSPEMVRMGMAGGGEASSSSYYPPYPQPNQNPNFFNPSFFNQPNYAPGPGPSYPGSSSYAPPAEPKEPPPPPSPPKASAWEFLNPFDNFEKYYPPFIAPPSRPYTPSRDSREVREEEGIPDLEEDDYQNEVVKEIHGHQKFADGKFKAPVDHHHDHDHDDDDDDDEEDDDSEDAKGEVKHPEALYRTRPSKGIDMESEAAEYEVHMVDKKVVHDNEQRSNGAKPRAGGFKGDPEVVREIQFQFERASESGNELARILEVGKLPHNRRHAAYQAKVSSKMLHAITPSLLVSSQPSASNAGDIEKAGPALLDAEDELNLRSKKLSSTMHKLFLWEKKLYEEVKAEEKMRILHEQKTRKLKRLDERGAEALKIDATRQIVNKLSTKIRIAIQVVDKISVTINKVRDEELWPQLHEFIKGLTKMWNSMLECHQIQCQAIVEAKRLDAVASGKHFSETHVEATSQLQHDVINWTVAFSCWIGAQKGYVRALNNWLMKCILYVPEETADGVVPFSPGREGAPPIFVICNQWSQALDRVSEKDVLDSMRVFASNVLNLWEQDKHGMRDRITASKDGEKRIKNLEKEDQKIHKEMQAMEKRMIMVTGDDNNLSLTGNAVYQSDTSKSGSIQLSLQRIFEAMERFTASSLKVHEELLQRIEEDLARETERIS